MSSIDTSTANLLTVAMTGLPAVTRNYTSVDAPTAGWSNVDSWSAGAGTSINASAYGLQINTTTATGYAARTVTSAAGLPDLRHVRARVRMNGAGDRPARVWISDNTGTYGAGPEDDTADWSRVVGDSPVIIDGWMPRNGPTSVRVNVARPAGSSGASVMVEFIYFDHQNNEPWWLYRTDVNGTNVRLAGWLKDTASSSGTFTYVDREAALNGTTSYTQSVNFVDTTVGPAQCATSFGLGALSQIDSPLIYTVTLIDYRMGRAGQGTLSPVLGQAARVASLHPMTDRTGSVTVRTAEAGIAHILQDLAGFGQVLLLRVNNLAGVDGYYVASRAQVEINNRELPVPYWDVTYDLDEVTRPPYA